MNGDEGVGNVCLLFVGVCVVVVVVVCCGKMMVDGSSVIYLRHVVLLAWPLPFPQTMLANLFPNPMLSNLAL